MLAGISQTGFAVSDDSGLAIDEATRVAEVLQRAGMAGHNQ